jgi:hypothetical protein
VELIRWLEEYNAKIKANPSAIFFDASDEAPEFISQVPVSIGFPIYIYIYIGFIFVLYFNIFKYDVFILIYIFF